MEMTSRRLAELEAANAERWRLKKAATPGPWCFEASTGSDAAFCAAARNDPVEDHVAELIAEVRRLQLLWVESGQ